MWRQHAGEQQNMQFSNVQQQESITMHMVEWKKKRKKSEKWSLIAADEQLETEQICSVFTSEEETGTVCVLLKICEQPGERDAGHSQC